MPYVLWVVRSCIPAVSYTHLIVTYAVMTLHGMLGGILVVMIVKGVTPVLRPLAFQQGKQGRALDVGWDGGSGQFQKSGGVINILHELRDITLLATCLLYTSYIQNGTRPALYSLIKEVYDP